MLRKLDFTLLPTSREVIRVKNEIKVTEQKLRDVPLDPLCTKTTAVELERELEMMTAWIAPIRRLNTDVLSLIFEMCGEDDCQTPLQIAATLHDWRNLVLSTPRAWEFLPLGDPQTINIIKLFLERSYPRPLHLSLLRIYATSVLSSISQRLECLTLNHFHDDMTKLSFPKLKRLRITGECTVQLSRIDATRFPALRHLVCTNWVTPLIGEDSLNFPPLQYLAVTLDTGGCWLRALQACQDTLISLQFITGDLLTTIPKPQLVFPRLICLEIHDRAEQSGAWPLDLKIPVLETYIEHVLYPGGSLIRPDAKTITQLRITRVPESFAFPRVKILQLRSIWNTRRLLRALSSNPAHFPELEIIEVDMSGEAPNHMVELAATVSRKRERVISLVFTKELRVLHGMINTQLVSIA
jgi:hypothetical protein